jgi:hypothetical protein
MTPGKARACGTTMSPENRNAAAAPSSRGDPPTRNCCPSRNAVSSEAAMITAKKAGRNDGFSPTRAPA